MLRHILLIVTYFNAAIHLSARSKTDINLYFLKYCQVVGNLYLCASTVCAMKHRWRVVTRDRDKKSHCNLNYVWTWSYSNQPLFYQIAKIERCRNCWSRNLTYKFCIGNHECSQTIHMNVHRLSSSRPSRCVMCRIYEISLFYGFRLF